MPNRSAKLPKVCIGVVTRNRAAIVARSISSALQQDYENKEVVVINDGSSDETAHLASTFPGVKWMNLDEPKGYLSARNRMMQESDAELFCSLDDDAWFETPDVVSEGVCSFEQCETVAAVAFDILSPDRPRAVSRRAAISHHQFIGCGHMLRLSTIRAAGYYAINPGLYGCEETDLSVRLLDAGHDIVFLPGVHVWHDKSSIGRDAILQYRSVVCNDLAFALRRFPVPMVFWKLPGKVLSHLRFALRHGSIKPWARGLWMFVRQYRALRRTRLPVSVAAIREYYRRLALERASA